MSRSPWRKRANEPKSIIGWWWYGIVEEDRFFGIQTAGLLLSLILMVQGVSWGLAPLAITLVAGWLIRRRERPDRLTPLLPLPEPPGQFRASIEYRHRGIVYGTDQAAVGVIDGWLYAEGVRSNFSLRTEDVVDFWTGSDSTARLKLIDGTEIRLKSVDAHGRLVLVEWNREKPPAEGESMFPPAKVHDQPVVHWGSYLTFGMLVIPVSDQITAPMGGTWWPLFAHWGGIGFGVTLTAIGLYQIERLLKVHGSLPDLSADSNAESSVASISAPERRLEEDRAEVRNL